MNLTHRHPAHAATRSIFALSVLALLALACFPVLAHADSAGVEYMDAPPTATGNNTIPKRSEPSAHSSKKNGGSSSNAADSTDTSQQESSAGGASSNSGGGSNAAKGDTDQQKGSPGKGAQKDSQLPVTSQPESSQSDDGSSPLAAILIAIAILAAISIGAVMMRQRRRRRDSGVSVSPKAS